LVFVEHEYGIFGGSDGEFVLDFVENLEKPFILNTHTILPSPEFHKRRILSKLGQRGTGCNMYDSSLCRALKQSIYNVPHKKLLYGSSWSSGFPGKA
jgi:hypothetical protein